MKNFIIQNKLLTILVEIIPALLILLFVYTATSKIITHNLFVYTLNRSPLLEQFSVPVSWILPAIELLISFLLIVPRWRHMGLILSTLLMSLFTLYLGYMVAFAPHLPCSCGGVLKELTWKQHLLFNIFFTVLAFAGWSLIKRKKILLQ